MGFIKIDLNDTCHPCSHVEEDSAGNIYCKRLFNRELDDMDKRPKWCPTRKQEAADGRS